MRTNGVTSRPGAIRLRFALTALLVALWIIGGKMQSGIDPALLKRLFPTAASFSPKGGDPPHVRALTSDGKTVIGLAFWTTELEPLERGYDGPIKILVGIDTKGLLTGIVVAEHHEPYGNFSIEPPQFSAQFKGKDVRDRFRVGADVDAVSRASITIGSATRAIRNSARRIARQYLVSDSK
jgi:NosR/NirI family transcriptional regulator, nitrous oxide reductase regulator